MKTCCVIPAYNEEKNIARVIRGVKNKVDEVVVVDDGSADETSAIAAREGATVLRHIINRDQGAALETGDEYALKNGADIIVHFDADGQFLAEEIADVAAPVKAGECDIVFGSRFMGREANMPWAKKNIIFPLARLVNRIFAGVKLTDPQSGFRALSKSAARRIAIEHDGKAHCSEIIFKTGKYGLKYKEVPITVVYHEFGQKFSGGVRILKDLFLGKLLN